MTLQQDLLSTNKDKIKSIFNLHKHNNAYMGVYFNQYNKPYITFKSDPIFQSPCIIGKNISFYAFTYNTSLDFDTQTDSFLS